MGAQFIQFALPEATWNAADDSLPKPGTLVRYRTALYQMFGYVDSRGQWMATDGTVETLPIEAWRELSTPASTWPERVA